MKQRPNQPHFDAAAWKESPDLPPVHEAVTQSCPTTVYVGGSAEGRRRCAKKIRKALQNGGKIDEQGPYHPGAAIRLAVLCSRSRHRTIRKYSSANCPVRAGTGRRL